VDSVRSENKIKLKELLNKHKRINSEHNISKAEIRFLPVFALRQQRKQQKLADVAKELLR
jgi:hypothetical protein